MNELQIDKVIAENLKKLLKEFRINQNELAKIAGVTESAAGKWILGKSTPRMGAIQKIADHFNLPKSYILEERSKKMPEIRLTKMPLFGSIAAGVLATVDGVTKENIEFLAMPQQFLGKYSTCSKLFAMIVNGESMNKVIKDGSVIVAKPLEIDQYKNGDIVIFSYNNEYSLKRYAPDELEGFVLFKSESDDPSFKDIPVPKSELDSLKLYGKVVYYGTTL